MAWLCRLGLPQLGYPFFCDRNYDSTSACNQAERRHPLVQGVAAFSVSTSGGVPNQGSYLHRVLRPVLLGLAGDMGDELIR
eukprot:scaffold668060_cov41-Prasinocladus_malaysianus.AAC.1